MIKQFLIVVLFLFSLGAISQNLNLSNGVVFDGEPYIVVNPNNSQHLVVAWMGFKLGNIIVIKTRTSFDAGQTWSPKTDISHTVIGYQSADPSLAFDNAGNVYLAFIDYTPSPATGAVYVVKSTDGGLNWGLPVEVINATDDGGTQYPVDRPWMVIDNSGGANDGNIYVTTMNPAVFGPVPFPYNPYFIRSTNGGASFEPWRHLDTLNWLAGNLIPQPMPTPCVAADGTIHTIYPSIVGSQTPIAQYIVASSTTAGSSFNHNTALAITTTNSDTLPKKGYILVADPSDTNHLLFAYPNFDNGDIDVYVTESLNAGSNWTVPIRINDDPISNNRMQDLIWVDFDDDGDVIVTWRDRRNSSDSTYTVNSEIYGAIRWNDSTSFSPNFMISDSSVSYNSILANSGNDFMSVQMINDTVYAVWGDTRNGFLNIWFQQIDLASGATSVKDLANDINPITAYPNPTKNMLTVDFGNNDLTNASYDLFSIFGKLISSGAVKNQKQLIDLTKLSSGNYILNFSNNNGSKTIKIIKNN